MIVIKVTPKLTVTFDAESDVVYVQFHAGKSAKTIEEGGFLLVDLNARGEPLGVEILSASKHRAEISRDLKRLATKHRLPELARINPAAISQAYA